jgi:hypothetical protein
VQVKANNSAKYNVLLIANLLYNYSREVGRPPAHPAELPFGNRYGDSFHREFNHIDSVLSTGPKAEEKD